MTVGTDSSGEPVGVVSQGPGYEAGMTTSATPRGLVFGTAAENYERFRLGYPDEVVDRTLSYATGQVMTAVEIGAGTGKATRAFASRGIQVTALEPDPEMFAVLQRETAGMPVTPVLSAFEEYDGPPTDLVYAGASWHSTDPRTRWSRAADCLAHGGVLSLFGRPMQVADPELQAAVAQASPPSVDDDTFRVRGHGSLRERLWDVNGPDVVGRFADVESHLLAREVTVSDREYIGYLSTLYAYLQLSPEERQDLLHHVADVIPEQVRLDLSVSLLLARRV